MEHLSPVPAGADAELQPAAAEVIDTRDRLRGDDRVPLDHQTDAAGDPEPGGRLSGRGQGHEQVVGAPVLGRQRLTRRLICLGRGNMRVLSKVQRALAPLLDQAGHGAGPHAVVRGKVADSKVHASFLPWRRVRACRDRSCSASRIRRAPSPRPTVAGSMTAPPADYQSSPERGLRRQ